MTHYLITHRWQYMQYGVVEAAGAEDAYQIYASDPGDFTTVDDDLFDDSDLLIEPLQHAGWGLVGDPQDGMIAPTASGPGIDVTGYNSDDYWDRETGEFLGEDIDGVVPVYTTDSGQQYPENAVVYPYRA